MNLPCQYPRLNILDVVTVHGGVGPKRYNCHVQKPHLSQPFNLVVSSPISAAYSHIFGQRILKHPAINGATSGHQWRNIRATPGVKNLMNKYILTRVIPDSQCHEVGKGYWYHTNQVGHSALVPCYFKMIPI